MKRGIETENHSISARDRVSASLAQWILRTQLNWSQWMTRCFSELSATRQKCLLVVFILLGCSCSAILILGKSPVVVGKIAQPVKVAKHASIIPSDSLLLMEYIYKTRKNKVQNQN